MKLLPKGSLITVERIRTVYSASIRGWIEQLEDLPPDAEGALELPQGGDCGNKRAETLPLISGKP